MSNIAEGASRVSKRDQARFTEIAYSSATEVLAQCMIAKDLGYMEHEKYLLIREKLSEITFLLSKLRKSQTDELNEPEEPYFTWES